MKIYENMTYPSSINVFTAWQGTAVSRRLKYISQAGLCIVMPKGNRLLRLFGVCIAYPKYV